MSIDIFPDLVLLEIFDFFLITDQYKGKEIETWQSLVHVCRQWRRVVFGSPHRLDLRLSCSTRTKTPVRDTLDIWPPLPLVVYGGSQRPEELDNLIAVLERSDRVRLIDISLSSSHLESASTAMQKPFPQLKFLRINSYKAMSLPDSFLGGSAPGLQYLSLNGIPFPGLPKLLSSATHLVHLDLINVPHSGYFSSEAIVTALSMLTSLEGVGLVFQFPLSPQIRRPPPQTRFVFPNLVSLVFKGVSEYLEDLVAHIDAPRLYRLSITFFNQIVFDAPQTIQFISRTPTLKTPKNARLTFQDDASMVFISSQTPGYGHGTVHYVTFCRESDWKLSFMEQVCTSCLPPLAALEDLIYEETYLTRDWKDNIENALWLELLHPFSAVKNLYLSEKIAPRIAPALQEVVGDSTLEVLPTLQNIFLEGLQPSGPNQEGIVKFVAARQLSGHPITVSLWDGTSPVPRR